MKHVIQLFLMLAGCLFAVNSPAQTLSHRIALAFRTFESDPAMQHGIASITVLNARTGAVIYTKNEQTGLSPASTLKTVTAATAYHLLGTGHRFDTRLSYAGTLDAGGVLKGDVIISGSGDPSLGSDRFEQSREQTLLQRWLLAIRQAGIRRIEGRIIGDDSLYGGQKVPGGWAWQNMGNYYGAGLSSLNWRENMFGVSFIAGSKPGQPVRIRQSSPAMEYLQLVNEVTTGKTGTGDQVYGFAAPYSSRLYMRGTYGADLRKTIYFSLPDAAYDAAYRLQQVLTEAGIAVSGEPTTAHQLQLSGLPFPARSNLIDTYSSPELGQLIYWFNQKSINLYGEALLQAMAVSDTLRTDEEDDTRVIRAFWEKKLNIPEGALRIIDGSGLSPQNRITTLAMARILQSLQQEPWFSSFYESLPLYNQMKMKSGTIGGVLGYAGYHTSKDGTPVVFSLLVNNYAGNASSMRQKMFRLLNTLK